MCWLSCQRSFLFLWPSLIDKAVKSRVLLSHCLPHVCVFLLSLSTETTRNMNSSWCSMIQNDQVLRHSPVRLSIRSCAGTVHSFARSARHPSLARSAALIRSLARSFTHSRACEKVKYCMPGNQNVLNRSVLVFFPSLLFFSASHFLKRTLLLF